MTGYPLQNDGEVLRRLGRKLVRGSQTDGLGFFIRLRLGKGVTGELPPWDEVSRTLELDPKEGL